MNDLFAVIRVLFFCILISCNDSTNLPGGKETSNDVKAGQQAQKNLDAWHTVSMAFQSGNPDAIDSVVALDYIDHRSSGDVKGRDSMKANIIRGLINFKDVKMETIREMSDDEYAFFWIHFTGNNVKGTNMPLGPFDMVTVQVVRFRDGMAIEHWEYMDPKQIMKLFQRASEKKNPG